MSPSIQLYYITELNCFYHIVMACLVQGFQANINIIGEAATVSEGFWWLYYYLLINKLSLFNKVAYILHFEPLCLIFIILGLFLFLVIIIILSRSRSLFVHLLFHHLFDNRYNLFYVLGCFHLFWIYLISVWNIGRHDPARMTCRLSVSGFFIFPHRLLLYQTWLLINKNKCRDKFIIIHHLKL